MRDTYSRIFDSKDQEAFIFLSVFKERRILIPLCLIESLICAPLLISYHHIDKSSYLDAITCPFSLSAIGYIIFISDEWVPDLCPTLCIPYPNFSARIQRHKNMFLLNKNGSWPVLNRPERILSCYAQKNNLFSGSDDSRFRFLVNDYICNNDTFCIFN